MSAALASCIHGESAGKQTGQWRRTLAWLHRSDRLKLFTVDSHDSHLKLTRLSRTEEPRLIYVNLHTKEENTVGRGTRLLSSDG